MSTTSRRIAALALAVATMAGATIDASAATARHYYNQGHGYGNHGGYAYRGGYGGGYRRHYGYGPAVRAAVAGTALGIIGAAAAAPYYGYDSGYYNPGYYGQGYYAPYGYDPY